MTRQDCQRVMNRRRPHNDTAQQAKVQRVEDEQRRRRRELELWAPYLDLIESVVPAWAHRFLYVPEHPPYRTTGEGAQFFPVTIDIDELVFQRRVAPIRIWSDQRRVAFEASRYTLVWDQTSGCWSVGGRYTKWLLFRHDFVGLTATPGDHSAFEQALADAVDNAAVYVDLLQVAGERNA